MLEVKLPPQVVADAVWGLFLDVGNRLPKKRLAELRQCLDEVKSLEESASFKTGSIPSSTAFILFGMASYFAPKRMLEIGTYIGRSTTALALGLPDEGAGGELYTCDSDNDIEIPKPNQCVIHRFPKTVSSGMLKELGSRQLAGTVELVFIDGRLKPGDVALLRMLCKENALLLIDDFHLLEKGVGNSIEISESKLFGGYRFVLPPSRELLRRYGHYGTSTMALFLPTSLHNLI